MNKRSCKKCPTEWISHGRCEWLHLPAHSPGTKLLNSVVFESLPCSKAHESHSVQVRAHLGIRAKMATKAIAQCKQQLCLLKQRHSNKRRNKNHECRIHITIWLEYKMGSGFWLHIFKGEVSYQDFLCKFTHVNYVYNYVLSSKGSK